VAEDFSPNKVFLNYFAIGDGFDRILSIIPLKLL